MSNYKIQNVGQMNDYNPKIGRLKFLSEYINTGTVTLDSAKVRCATKGQTTEADYGPGILIQFSYWWEGDVYAGKADVEMDTEQAREFADNIIELCDIVDGDQSSVENGDPDG